MKLLADGAHSYFLGLETVMRMLKLIYFAIKIDTFNLIN